LSFAVVQGRGNPTPQTISLTSAPSLAYTASVVSNPAGWLAVLPANGSTNGDPLSVLVQTGQLAAGTYTGTVTVVSNSAQNANLTIPVVLAVVAAPPGMTAALVTTLAGGAQPPTSAPGTSVSVPVSFVAVAPDGTVYFTSYNLKSVFKLDRSGVVTRFAGAGDYGFSGDGGAAIGARLSFPNGLAIDSAGNVLIADSNNQRIRRVDPNGVISTIAGNGTCTDSGDGGPATSAGLCYPVAVSLDAKNNVYITERARHRIRKVVPDGTISTVAGNGSPGYSGDGARAANAQLDSPMGTAIDSSGYLFIADANNRRVRRVAPDGTVTTVAGTGTCCSSGDGGLAASAQLNYPSGVAVDASGKLYIADSGDNRVRVVTPDSRIASFAGVGGFVGFAGDDGPAAKARLCGPASVSLDSTGNVYIADACNQRVRKVSPAGTINTVAGGRSQDGDLAPFAGLNSPSAVARDRATGDLYVVERLNHRVRKIAPDGSVATIAGTGISGFSGDGGPAVNAQLDGPCALAVDYAGNIFVADCNTNRIRKVTGGAITTVAGNGTSGYSGDRGPATSASFTWASSLAVDAAGNLYIADTNNHRIRRVAPDGTITTVAGNGAIAYSGDNGPATTAALNWPRGVAADSSGVLYIADTNNQRIRRVSLDGTITTVAGTGSCCSSGDGVLATAAVLSYPLGVAVDPFGNLFIADTGGQRVREVTTDGMIATVAGVGTYDYLGDGGPALQGSFRSPSGIFVDDSGAILIADTDNNAIRALVPMGSSPVLTVKSTHSGTVIPGNSATFNVVVKNAVSAAPTNSGVTVIESLPSGLSLASMAGDGWSCAGATCTRADSLTGGLSYSPIAVTVNVGLNAPPQVTNRVTAAAAGAILAADEDLTLVGNAGLKPVISLVANAFGESPQIAPNTWVEIKGSNLAPTSSARIWKSDDFAGDRMPTQLDGVSVTVNGKNAYIYYISPDQVNILTAPDSMEGLVAVQLTDGAIQTAPVIVQAQQSSPSFFVIDGGPYVTALHSNGGLVGPSSLYPGVTTPTSPGETIVLYANGFGPTSSPVVSGSPVQSGTLPGLPEVQIGGQPATVTFAGLVSPGLYQLNVIVPFSVPAGDNAITATCSSGLQSQPGVLITVQQP
jgi:uncharacterized protein (TIGR03437 family)